MTSHRASRSIGRIAALVVLGWLVAACGSGATPVPSEPPPTIAAPSHGSPAPTGGSAGMPGCPNFVEVVESGPTFGGEDQGEFGPLAQEQARLERDVTAAQEYGAEHADEFASIRFENGPRVRIVIAFTGHIAEHCAALRELLAFPEEFEIILQDLTEADLQQIHEEIIDIARPFLLSVGSGGADGQVHVQLRANGEAMAAQLAERYGDVVAITVGLFSFPDKQLAEGGGCGLPVDQLLDDSPFRAALQLEPGPVRSGADFEGIVRVTNVGLTTEMFESGQPMTAMVFRPGGSDVVGVYTGGIAGTGAGSELDPLESYDIRVLGGTASCDPALGYALPPGEYEVRALVDQYVMHPNAATDIWYILSDPAPLTIVP